MPREPVVRTPFTERDIALIRALRPGRVHYYPGCSGKRFARDMNVAIIQTPDLGITHAQRQFMRAIAYKYRKRLPDGLRPADPLSADEIAQIDEEDEWFQRHRHLEPSDAELEELAAFRRDAIAPQAVDADLFTSNKILRELDDGKTKT